MVELQLRYRDDSDSPNSWGRNLNCSFVVKWGKNAAQMIRFYIMFDIYNRLEETNVLIFTNQYAKANLIVT